MKKYLFIVTVLIMFGGCSNQNNNLSIQEQIELNKNSEKSKTHIFKNRTKDEVLEALQKVLDLSDGDDYKVTYFEDKIQIKRFGFAYYIIGFDTMHIEIEVKVKVAGDDIIFITSALASGGGVLAGRTSIIESPLFYDFFYNRIEFILNMNNEKNPYKWVTCNQEEKRIANKYGMLEVYNVSPLCSFADDYTPEQYIKKYGK